MSHPQTGTRVFKPHPRAAARRRSVAALLDVLLANRNSDVLSEHVRELVGILLWKMTEADGKYKTRYQSAGALLSGDKSLLRHDHVFPRMKLIDLLLNAKPEQYEGVLENAIACTVTFDEHIRLSKFDETYVGWDRYRQAMVTVINTETGERLI